MAVLIPLPASDFSAVYAYPNLTLLAKGEIPRVVLGADLVRDNWAGGLKFSFEGYYGGILPKDPQPATKAFSTEYKEQINLPMPHFNNRTVLVETANGTWEVEIKSTGCIPQPKGGLDEVLASAKEDLLSSTESSQSGKIINSVLPPIKVSLPGGQPGQHVVHLTAPVPEKGFSRSSHGSLVSNRSWAKKRSLFAYVVTTANVRPSSAVSVKYNQEYLRVWSTTVTSNNITWVLTWQKTPTGEADPQDFTIITRPTLPMGPLPVGAGMFGTVQSYFVYLALLKSQ